MRFYRALLRFYPAFFRAEYRDELCGAFAERARELSGPVAPVRTILAALADLSVSGAIRRSHLAEVIPAVLSAGS